MLYTQSPGVFLRVVHHFTALPDNNRGKTTAHPTAKVIFLPALGEILFHRCACKWMSRP